MTDEKHRLKTMTRKELYALYKTYDDLCYGPNACYGVSDMIYLDMIAEEIQRRDEQCRPPYF